MSSDITLGNPALGHLRIGGSGIRKRANYDRCLAHYQLAFLPSNQDLLHKTPTFEVSCREEISEFN